MASPLVCSLGYRDRVWYNVGGDYTGMWIFSKEIWGDHYRDCLANKSIFSVINGGRLADIIKGLLNKRVAGQVNKIRDLLYSLSQKTRLNRRTRKHLKSIKKTCLIYTNTNCCLAIVIQARIGIRI